MEDSVTLATVEAWISDYETGLRSGYPEDKLPPTWEEELHRIDRSRIEGALRYWGTLKAFIFATHESRRRGPACDEATDTATTAFELLARVPIAVPLSSGRTVQITGRSLLALTEMSAHESRITLLQAQQEDAMQRYANVAAQRRGANGFRARRLLRRRMRHLEEIIRGTFSAIVRHRERWIAHAATMDGGPAAPDQPAPSWWREVADEDWARLVLACYEAGPGRYARLGDPPPRQPRKGESAGENFGAITILSAWGVRLHVRPAQLMGVDYGQMLVEMRASSPPTLDESME